MKLNADCMFEQRDPHSQKDQAPVENLYIAIKDIR
jgi:hypothetical protein